MDLDIASDRRTGRTAWTCGRSSQGFWPRVHDPGPERRLLLRLRGTAYCPNMHAARRRHARPAEPVAKAHVGAALLRRRDRRRPAGGRLGLGDPDQPPTIACAARTPTIVSALEIMMPPGSARPGGLSGLHARRDARQRGQAGLHGPGRAGPAERQDPASTTPIDEYAYARTPRRPAGRPVVARPRPGRRESSSTSRTPAWSIPGTLAQWRDWTGLPFDTGAARSRCRQALVPVHCDVEPRTRPST